MSDFIEWVTHGVKRGRFDLEPRAIAGLFVFISTLTVVTALYLMLVSRTAARGRCIEQLQAELAHLQRENARLEVELVKKASVSRLMERATALGFVPAERVVFLKGIDEAQDVSLDAED